MIQEMVRATQVRLQNRLVLSWVHLPLTRRNDVKKLIALLIALAATAAVASSAIAAPQTSGAKGAKKKPVVTGFYRGHTVGYFDFGPIKLKPGNKLAPIWSVTNPADGQHNII